MTALRLYSVRMRAEHGGRHLSGAERLVREQLLGSTVANLVERAQAKGIPPDKITVSVEAIGDRKIDSIRSLDLVVHDCADTALCRSLASASLVRAGVSERASSAAFGALDGGPAPSGGNMRGAMVMDAQSGERLEPDRERGIRASRFDWSESAETEASAALALAGLAHVRTREALALASKVAHAPGIVAELCWSDDPDYSAGYVAAPALGYQRFSHLKEEGGPFGGRVFFVDRAAWSYEPFRSYLQERTVIIDTVGAIRSAGQEEPRCRTGR